MCLCPRFSVYFLSPSFWLVLLFCGLLSSSVLFCSSFLVISAAKLQLCRSGSSGERDRQPSSAVIACALSLPSPLSLFFFSYSLLFSLSFAPLFYSYSHEPCVSCVSFCSALFYSICHSSFSLTHSLFHSFILSLPSHC